MFELDDEVICRDEIVVLFEQQLDDDEIENEVEAVHEHELIDEVDDDELITQHDEHESLSDETDAFSTLCDDDEVDDDEHDEFEHHHFIDVYIGLVDKVEIIFDEIDDLLLSMI